MRDDAVGVLLRDWRRQRRLSQEQLAHRAEVSTRHLSCVETGRSRPTATLVDRLAETLEVPIRERNRLLLAAGFAPRYGHRSIDDAELEPVLDGLRSVLTALLPNPGLLIDDRWDVVDANAAAWALAAGCDPALLAPPINIIRISLHPGGLAPRVTNLAQWAAHLHRRVLARAERTGDPVLRELASEITTYADIGSSDGRADQGADDGPVLALEITEQGHTLRFCVLVAQLETARDATLQELHLETLLPADRATQDWLRAASGL